MRTERSPPARTGVREEEEEHRADACVGREYGVILAGGWTLVFFRVDRRYKLKVEE